MSSRTYAYEVVLNNEDRSFWNAAGRAIVHAYKHVYEGVIINPWELSDYEKELREKWELVFVNANQTGKIYKRQLR